VGVGVEVAAEIARSRSRSRVGNRIRLRSGTTEGFPAESLLYTHACPVSHCITLALHRKDTPESTTAGLYGRGNGEPGVTWFLVMRQFRYAQHEGLRTCIDSLPKLKFSGAV
jgi:hypothetical protein